MTNGILEVPGAIARSHTSGGNIGTVNRNTFSSLILAAEGPIAAEFMSYGCSHCRALEPVLQKVAEMVKSKVKIFRVNTAVDEDLAGQYEIRGTPTLVMFLNGKEIGRVEGPSPTLASVLEAVAQPFELENVVA